MILVPVLKFVGSRRVKPGEELACLSVRAGRLRLPPVGPATLARQRGSMLELLAVQSEFRGRAL